MLQPRFKSRVLFTFTTRTKTIRVVLHGDGLMIGVMVGLMVILILLLSHFGILSGLLGPGY